MEPHQGGRPFLLPGLKPLLLRQVAEASLKHLVKCFEARRRREGPFLVCSDHLEKLANFLSIKVEVSTTLEKMRSKNSLRDSSSSSSKLKSCKRPAKPGSQQHFGALKRSWAHFC